VCFRFVVVGSGVNNAYIFLEDQELIEADIFWRCSRVYCCGVEFVIAGCFVQIYSYGTSYSKVE